MIVNIIPEMCFYEVHISFKVIKADLGLYNLFRCVMVWNEVKDLTMLKEVAAEGVLTNKVGSRERGAAWQNVAISLTTIHGFGVTARSLRDRHNILSKKLKAKLGKEVRESGGGDDGQSEVERLLEELMEVGEEI